MKKITDSKIFWALVSLFAALFFWVYVTGVESDDYTRTFRGVGIEFVGKSVLTERGLVATDINTGTVTLEVSGPRRIVASMSSDDIKAQINVSNLSQASNASMQYTVCFPDGTDTSELTIIRKIPETVSFTVSKQVTKVVPVKGSFDGSVAENYMAEPAEYEPSIISISGPEVYLKDVSYAWVSFGRDETVDSTYSTEIGYTLMNEDKEPVQGDGITSNVDLITATLPILKLKDVPLDIELIYKSGADSSNTVVSIEPKVITLAGDSSILDGLNRINLGTISTDEFENAYSSVLPIVIDNSLINVAGINEAEVSVKIDGLSTKMFKLAAGNISIINVTDGYEAEILSKGLEVTLRGTEEDLGNIKSENIRAVADLKDFDATEGSHIVRATIFVDGTDKSGAIGEHKIQIEISKVG